MSQKPDPQPFAFGGTFDDARDVGHDEAAVVAVADDAEVGHQGGEGIVGDLRSGGRNDRQQGRFAGIGEAHEAHIGQQLQLHDDPAFLRGLAWLGELGRLHGGRLEEGVAFAAAAALEQHDGLSVLGDLAKRLAGLGFIGHRAQRHVDEDVLAGGACELVAAAWDAIAGHQVLGVAKVQQGPHLGIASQDDVAATTAVAAVRTAFWDIFLTAEMQRTSTAFAGTAVNLHVVNEIRTGHNDLILKHVDVFHGIVIDLCLATVKVEIDIGGSRFREVPFADI